jgi:hypothetical protein
VRRLAKASFAGSTDGTGSSRGRFRRAFAALAGTGSLALVLALLVAPAASAAPWGFEQVTPPNKGAGAVMASDTFRPSQDGNSFLYSATAPFDGVPTESSPAYTRYIGFRGADSWLNRGLDPLFGGLGTTYNIMSVVGSSTDLSYVMVGSTAALAPGAIEDGGNLYMRNTRTGALTLIAASPDPELSRVITGLSGAASVYFVANDGRSAMFITPVPLVPGAPSGPFISVLYTWTADGGVEAASVLPADEGGEIVRGGFTAGAEAAGPRRSIPEGDGLAHVYFSSLSNEGWGPAYVRSNGVTKAISYSRIPGDPTTPVRATVEAMGTDGRFAVFSTVEGINGKLTSDTQTGPFQPSYYYRYDANDDSLAYIGRKGEGPPVVGVIQMSQDGQTVVFQSNAALTPGSVDGGANTYIWRQGSLQLVETPDPGSTGASTGEALRVLSGNGRYYSFSDNSATLAAQFGVTDNTSPNCPGIFSDVGPCDEMYLYDADAEELSCSSCLAGQAPRGHAGDRLGTFTRMDSHQMQTVANDGTVFFTSPEQLVAADNNNLRDAYAAKDGEWRLLSRGTQGTSSRFLDATDDGKTVFISTDDPIAPTDTDGAVDVYMTREGAGYPYTPPVVPPVCAGIESCHAGVPATPTQSSAGSSSFEGRGNEKPRSRKGGDKLTVAKPRPATGSNGALKIKAPGKGKLTITGPGVKKATKSVSKSGTYTLKVTLTPQARKALEKSGQAQKKLKVTFKPSQGKAQSATVKLTFKASAGKKGGRQS